LEAFIKLVKKCKKTSFLQSFYKQFTSENLQLIVYYLQLKLMILILEVQFIACFIDVE